LIAVLAGLGGVILLVVVLVAVGALSHHSDRQTAGGPVAPSQSQSLGPTATTPVNPTVPAPGAGSSTGPVPCATGGVFECFPQATVSSVVKILTGKGAVCSVDADTHDTVCRRGVQASSIDVTLATDPGRQSPDRLATFQVLTGSRTTGDNPKGRALVISNLKASMPTLMAALLPNEPKVQQDITNWLTAYTEKCPPQPVKVDSYQVSCDAPQKFVISDSARYTSWTFGLTVDSATAFATHR
jgi:hypothetical protein